MVRKALELPARSLAFEDRPAIGRVTVSSPAIIRPLARLNEGKSYPEQIKPFNFLLTCHVKAFGHPKGADAEYFHLIAPYNSNASHWLKMPWIDQYTGNSYRITTAGHSGTRRTARVKTYGDVLREYEFHLNRSAPMQREIPVKSRQSACCGVGTSASITFGTLARNQISWKRSMLGWFVPPKLSTQNTLTKAVMNGRRRSCLS